MNTKIYFLIVIVATLLAGCAHRFHNYEGQKPNLSLSGEEAQKEIRRFELEEDRSICGLPCFKYDTQKGQHTWESIRPLLEEVSPRAVQEYQKAKIWGDVQLYTVGIGVAGLVAGLAANGSQRDTFFSLSIVGSVVSIGSSFFVGSVRSKIPKIYNDDLKEKFAPSVGMIWPIE